MLRRPRRNRKSAAVRAHAQETHLSVDNLIYPFFLIDGEKQKVEVASLPGNYRWSPDMILGEIEECLNLGLHTFDIFPAFPEHLKDKEATLSYRENFYLQTIYEVKKRFPEACVMTDVAMDPYSSDGHDGLVGADGRILNDETLPILAKMTIAQAQAGADIIGPSDMMDGRVGYLRNALDKEGFTDVSIMSYTAKYASAYYNPFRDALDSAPKSGDKKTYQMNPANKWEALIEAELDYAEGADYMMVKPALGYLDVIHILKENYNIPIAAYNVSGECAMLIAACQNGWLDFDRAMPEMLMSIRRAGADVILTYFAKAFAQMQKR